MEVNAQNLLENGYTRYPDAFQRHYVNCMYQKCFTDKKGNKKYHLQFTEYDNSINGNNPQKVTFEADMQIHTADNQTINFTFLAPHESLEIVEFWA